MENDMGMSNSSMCTIIKTDLRLFPKCQGLISSKKKQKRLHKGKILNWSPHPTRYPRFFEELFAIIKDSVMLREAVPKTWKSPSTLVNQGIESTRITNYINNNLVPAKREIKKHFKDKDFIIQKDSSALVPFLTPF